MAIVDCMMNLPLLFWAAEVMGQPFYQRIAMTHADTTLKYFIREDDSVCHAYCFDEETGAPIGVENYCGYDKTSHWARGTGWAIYGFTIAYSYTQKKEYLDVAIRLANRFLSLCEEDGIPVWDFHLPKGKPALYNGAPSYILNWDVRSEVNRNYNRDTSAAAITVCGIYEILKHKPDDNLAKAADKILQTLCETYVDYSEEVSGLLRCQNGNMTYTCYGDYYLMEALVMKEYKFQGIW